MDQRSEYGHLPASWLIPCAFGCMVLIAFGVLAAMALNPTPPLTIGGSWPVNKVSPKQ